MVEGIVRDQFVRINVQCKPQATRRLEVRQNLRRWRLQADVMKNQLRCLGALPRQFALHGWRGHRESLGKSMGGVSIGAGHFVGKDVGKVPRAMLLEREAACACATVTCKTLPVCMRALNPRCVSSFMSQTCMFSIRTSQQSYLSATHSAPYIDQTHRSA